MVKLPKVQASGSINQIPLNQGTDNMKKSV